MTSRHPVGFWLTHGLLALVALAIAWPGSAQAADEALRPNIIFLLADDMRPDCIAALGNDRIITPNLDRLVREGTTFTRAITGNPLCVPSRAEMITGRTTFRSGVFEPSGIDPALVMWPAALRDGGYHTWHVGKWHVKGAPRERGYTATDGWYGSAGGDLTFPLDHRGKPVTGYTGWQIRDADEVRHPELGIGLTPNISELFADAAIRMINRKPDAPFFLHVNFTAPHDPLWAPKGWEDRYQASEMPLPPNYLPEHPFDHGNFHGRDELLMDFPRTPEEVRRELAVYYAVISHLDQEIGRILAALEASDQLDNTVVIFSADHGMSVGSHGLRGKQNMYEHTVNVPFVMRGPGIPAGVVRTGQCYLRDLFPTTCELAGVPIPSTVESQSLLPLIRGDVAEIYPAVFSCFRDAQRMIRTTDGWKLAYYPLIDHCQLFHVKQDPYELDDLIDDPAQQERIAELKSRLQEWRVANDDPLLRE